MKKKYKKPALTSKKISFNYFYNRRRSLDSIGLLNEGAVMMAWSCVDTCFVPGSKVFMANGDEKNIENIKVNEEVYSYNLVGEELVKNKVIRVIEKFYDKGYLIINDSFKPTPNHPYWVVNREEWQPADQLKIGDELLSSENKKIRVKTIKKVAGSYTVYNLHLQDKEHNFFVEKILVHNTVCD